MMSKKLFVLAGVLALAPVAPARADVQLAIQNGRVTLNANGATVREILAEWAKIGHTKIVNGDRVPGGPVTLQLTDVAEAEALEIILRSVSGYVAAPRPTDVVNASRFDRIYVMPTSAPPRNVTPPPPAFPQPNYNPQAQPPPFNPQPQPPQFNPQANNDDEDDEEPAPNVPNPRGPIFNTFPQPTFVPPGQTFVPPGQFVPGQPGAIPQVPPGTPPNAPAQGNMPVGVSVPGMIVQPPQQQGRPGQIFPSPDQRRPPPQ